jgi:putative aldouronate transport system substrate-binding protein
MGRAVDVYRLASIWGVRGLESRTGGYLYLDRNGEMKDARLEMEFMDGVERLNMLYKEGLILQNFDTLDATEGLTGADHRDRLNRANLGFATYDYNQTTTNLNILESKIPGFELTPVLPPVADWDRTGDYYQFTESWRSTNNQGWGVVRSVEADQAKLYRALKLVDYMYSPEGNALMSYGPELWINGEIEYFGRQIPKLSDAAINELNELAGGNYPNYYRMWLGAMFPIGYIKDQGAEYQVTHPAGQKGLDKILRACQLGTMRHLVTGKAKARNPSDLLLPSMFALDYPDEIILREQVETFNAVWRPGMNDTDRILVTDYVLFGFGGKTYFGETLLDKQGLIDYQTDVLNADVYLSIYSSVYEIMRMAAGMDSL